MDGREGVISCNLGSMDATQHALTNSFKSPSHLVPFLREEYSLNIRTPPPEAQSLIQVEHRYAREVRHPRDCLQEEEPAKSVPPLKDNVKEVAQSVVWDLAPR